MTKPHHHSDTDSEKSIKRSRKHYEPPIVVKQPSRTALYALRVAQLVLAIGVIVALAVSWHVKSYGSVFSSRDTGLQGGFGGFGGGFGMMDGVMPFGYGGEDGLGFSNFGRFYGSYYQPFSSTSYVLSVIVAGVSILVSIGMCFVGAPLISVIADGIVAIGWIVCSSMLVTSTSICMYNDRDRQFINYQIHEMMEHLPWNFASRFQDNINLYCGGVFAAVAMGKF